MLIGPRASILVDSSSALLSIEDAIITPEVGGSCQSEVDENIGVNFNYWDVYLH
ncbi:hypothetical protein [Pleionea sediminis]|uniref:hypothetical protein n=1 Tax=Pleionea sediminis TaxID=2569479 RepID=UPI0013DE601F|nr:hypothetical protein [Pleionea sediminis]